MQTSVSRWLGRADGRSGRAAVVVIAFLVVACGSNPAPSPVASPVAPSPSASIAAPPASPSPSPAAPAAGDLALEACDLTGTIPCEHQAVLLSEPVTGTGVALTYSSEWAPGRKDRPGWDVSAQGLGGWSLDVLQRYDPATRVLLSGDGSWRFAKGVVLPSGERAVPSYDGLRAYVFDANGRHVRTVDALLGTTLVTFTYDAAGRLAGANGSLDGTPIHLLVEREADGTLSGLVGSDGTRTTLFLDSDGHLGGTKDPAGRAIVFSATPDGLVTTYYDATGGVSRYAYDDVGRLASTTDPDGVAVTYARTATADSIEVRSTTALGRIATDRSERSGDGRMQTYTAPDGTRTTVSTDATGQRAVALPDGTTIALGTQPDPRWGADAPIPTPVDQTRPDGATSHATTAIVVTTAAGDPLAVSAWSRTDVAAGGTWTETADPISRTITWSDPAGRKTTQTYDTAGRMVSQVAPGQPDLAFAYDDRGRLATRISGSGAAAAKTTYAYGADGVAIVTGPDGVVERLTADSLGRIVRRTAADGATVITGFDSLGRLVRVAPAGEPSTTIGLSAAGRQTGFLPPTVGTDGSYETRTYDTDGNLAAIAGPGDRSIVYTYDAMGRITGWTFDQGTATAAYDPATGLLATTMAPGGIGTQLSYAGGIPVGLAASGPVAGAVTETLDPQGRVASETVDGSAPVAYAYDTAGLLTAVGHLALQRDPASGAVSQATLGAVQTTRTYDVQGRAAGIGTSVGGKPALDLRYAYDLRGRVTSVTETRAGGIPVHTTYAYDTSGRLAGVSVDGTQVERDGYDAAGNRVTVKTPSGTLAATYDDRDRLTSWGAARYTSRPDGQLAGVTAAGATTDYTFDDFGDLRAVALPDGRRIDYLVDATGARVGKKVDGTLVAGYLYAPDGRLAALTDGTGAVSARFGYDDAGHLALVDHGGTPYQVVTDHLGSPLLVVDAARGAVAEAITYDAWGNVTSDTQPGFIPIGFAGGLHDADTGLVKFGAREYDPWTGRWTGPDPIRYAGGDAVLYRYVAGDPVNGTDPTGLKPRWESRCVSGDPMCDGGGGGGGHGGPPPPVPPAPAPYDPNASPPWGPIDITSPYTGPYSSNPPPPTYPPPEYRPFDWCRDFAFCKERQWRDPFRYGGFCYTGICNYGDPHERTADGVRFDFQAAGEFRMVQSADGSVVVQARLEPLGSSTIAAVGTAVAASVAGDRVAVYTSEAQPLTIAGVTESRSEFSVRLPHGGIVERHGPLVSITWPGGSRLDVQRGRSWLDLSLVPDPATAPTLRGLLGSADGNPGNDLTARDGTVIDPNDPAFATKLYDPFGKSWRITQAESLFDYAPGETTATFTKLDIPHGPATIDSLDTATRTKAAAICRAMGVISEPTLTNCILDVGITGDSSYAASAAAVQVSTATAAAQLPGGDAGPASTRVKTVSGTISKPGEVDRTTFDAKAGDVVYIDAQGACVPGLVWSLFGPAGREMSLDLACRDLGRFVLPDPGTYSVEVTTNSDTATGAYAFEILGAPVERTSAIAIGQAVSDTTTRIGEWHAYTFSGKAGDAIFLDATGPYVSGLTWRLVGPSGSLSIGNSTDDLGRIVLPETGAYAVEVYADGTATGAYSFQLRSGS